MQQITFTYHFPLTLEKVRKIFSLFTFIPFENQFTLPGNANKFVLSEKIFTMLKNLAFLFLFFIWGTSCQSKAQKTDPSGESMLTTAQDRFIAEKLAEQFSAEKGKPTAMLVAAIGRALLGTPYVAHTLENGNDEPLVVNLREMDCTTFVENCLALAVSIKTGESGFADFAATLEKIRYRQGKRAGYTSRLHYFSEWIADNREKGLVSEPAADFGSPMDATVNFMSSHAESYAVLKENPELTAIIAQQEKVISEREMFFLKKENVEANEDKLHEGDLVGLTTSIPGLDVSHTGILVRVNGHIHLLHASSSLAKVVISEEPLTELLKNKKSYTGIVIARPL